MPYLSLALASLLAGPAPDTEAPAPRFAPPVELTAAGAPLAGARHPSPALADLDGDGVRELLVANLSGAIAVHDRARGGPATAWGAARALEADGAPVDLDNW